MIKLNKKGFMMAEVIVVSAVIMTTLVALYTSYNKIFSIYNQRVKYYDITTLNELAFIRDNDCIVNYDITDQCIKDIEGITDTNEKKYNRILLSLTEDEMNYISDDDTNYVKENLDKLEINKTYKEYINYLSSSVNISEINDHYNKEYENLYDGEWKKGEWTISSLIIMERCKINDKNACTYAYIEKFAKPK